MREEGAPESDIEQLVEEALDSKEPIKKPKAEKLRPQGLLERIILSKWTAPVFAIAISAVNYTTPRSPPASITENLMASAVVAGFSYATAGLIRQDWLIRKAEAVRRKVRPLPFKLLNIFSEHPEIIASGISAYFTANLVSPMFTSITPSDVFRHPASLKIAADLSAYIFSTIFAISYPATSLALGRVFHPETAKTLLNATAATVNAYRESYKEAANHLATLLQTQRTYSKAVELQTLSGDLQILDENFAGFDTYIDAISTDKTSYVGRSDWVLGPFTSLLGRIVKHRKKPEWTEARNISHIISGTHAFAKGKRSGLIAADTAFRLAVMSQHDSVLAHTARATFLRKTGQHKTADLEMMVRAEQVMNDPNAEREVVEGRNRNIVFFSGNVAVKQNKDKKPLEDEQAIVKKYRERFGASVIYPMPVYLRGGFYHFTSEKYISQTLLDLIKQKKATLEDFVQALELMVQFQKFGQELYRARQLPLDDSILRIDPSKPDSLYFARRRLRAIEQIERFNGVKMPESYKAALGFGSAFIDRALAKSRLLAMYKDFSPKNVLKRPFGQMQVLDFELSSLRLLPPQMDFINLTGSEEYLSPQQLFWLRSIYFRLQERANKSKIDREEFEMIHAFSGFQWHYERLIYSTSEAATARTEEQREEKKKDQVRHLLTARDFLDQIIEKKYVNGEDLEAALRDREELKRPIFPDKAEYDRLCALVERERKELLLKEPLPISKTRLALASTGAMAVLAAFVLVAVSVRNNLVPVLNVPVFPQGDKILMSELTIKQKNGERVPSVPNPYKYYVIDPKTDGVTFLTDGAAIHHTDLAAFQDKTSFVRYENGWRIVLYDFRTKKFKAVEDDKFENPAISPNGLWIASTFRSRSSDTTEVWFIRTSDMKTRRMKGLTDISNAFVEPQLNWSPNGSYLVFFSHGELKGSSPDTSKVWINTYNISTGKVHEGPLVAERWFHLGAWSSNGELAYTVEDLARVYLSDPEFKRTNEAYDAGNRPMFGYETEEIREIKFVGLDNLLIESVLHSKDKSKSRSVLSLLNLKNKELTALDGTAFFQVSKDGRVLYRCNDSPDVCEFDVKTGNRRNLTNTPQLLETSAVYSPNDKKLYVVAIPPEGCSQGCITSLFIIDSATGQSKLLKQSQGGKVQYELIVP